MQDPPRRHPDAGRVRTDLFHRLRVLPLRVPSLAERRGDLPALSRRILASLAKRHGRTPLRLSPDALTALEGYSWPGNVRELGHVLERAFVNARGTTLTADDLPPSLASPEPIVAGATSERPTLEELERRYVAVVLKDTRGNQSRAAEILGISRKALWEKRKRYGLA